MVIKDWTCKTGLKPDLNHPLISQPGDLGLPWASLQQAGPTSLHSHSLSTHSSSPGCPGSQQKNSDVSR